MPARPVMRIAFSQVPLAVLALALVLPGPSLAQQPPVVDPVLADPQEAPEDPAKAAAAALAGSWAGWARLGNDWPDLACRYEGSEKNDSVRLELTNDDGLLHGSLAIDLPAEAGGGCPALRKRYGIAEVSMGPGTLSFTDSGGNEWTLSLRRSGTVLQGMLAWRAGGPDQPLAEGFATAEGKKPLARLAGEVRLRRSEAEAPASAAATETAAPVATGAAAGSVAAAPPRKTGAGGHLKNLGLVLGANVVGVAALYGVNKAGQGSSTTGAVTCSPRYCIVGAPNAPCLCYNDIVVGAPCNETVTGIPEGGTGCDGTVRPCASGLSCNSSGGMGLCQAENGRCPF